MTDLLNAKNILVCLRWGIGDLVMETPALDSLRYCVPAAHITAIGAVPATDLMEEDPSVDACFTYQEFGITHWGDEGDASRGKRFKEWLQKMRFDAVLDPSHAPLAIGRGVWETGGKIFDALHEKPDPVLQAGGSCVEAVKSVVRRGWGISVPEESNPRIRLGRKAESRANEFIQSNFPDDRPVVALSPVASSLLKAWPVTKFRELYDRLAKRGFNLLVFCGPSGPSPYAFGPSVERTSRKMIILTSVHLLHAASLLSRCNLLVCNDTGLMHVAAAVSTPVVGLFGPTDPSAYLPREPESIAVTSGQAECRFRRTFSLGPSECLLHQRCFAGGKPCISNIELRDVLSAVEQSLSRPSGRLRAPSARCSPIRCRTSSSP